MKEFWNVIQFIFSAIGGWLGYFLGGCDGLLYALLIFVIIDYITGVMCAVNDKKLSSAVGFRGICRKILILLLVGLAHILDEQVLHQTGVIRTAVIFFFLANDGLSILENAAHLGLPIPEQLKDVLEQLHDRAGKSCTDEEEIPEVAGEPVTGKHEKQEADPDEQSQ
ncbi:MAG: phage holin family protein [Clostridiales bacterium]|nr:phage holin family protein [Clostridiales bacterium]